MKGAGPRFVSNGPALFSSIAMRSKIRLTFSLQRAVHVVYAARRHDPAVDVPGQRGVLARTQRVAGTMEACVGAEHPGSAFDQHRRSAVVKADPLQVGYRRALDHYRLATEIRLLVHHDP